MKIKKIMVWSLAAFFSLNTIAFAIYTSELNTSTYAMMGASLLFILYGIFGSKIDKFCEKGFGAVVKNVFLVGVSLFLCVTVFITINSRRNTVDDKQEVIIILGAGIKGETVSVVLALRLQKGLELFEKTPGAVIVVTGGKGAGERIPEGVAMSRWLVAKGVPENKIFVEDASVSTEENLLFTKEIFKENGWSMDTPVAVVTNDFHCFRSLSYAKLVGFTNVKMAPAKTPFITLVPSYLRETAAVIVMWIFKYPQYMFK